VAGPQFEPASNDQRTARFRSTTRSSKHGLRSLRSEVSKDGRSVSLPLNLLECARPRAQKHPNIRCVQTLPKPLETSKLAAPGTGALRFRGSKCEGFLRRILSPRERAGVRRKGISLSKQ